MSVKKFSCALLTMLAAIIGQTGNAAVVVDGGAPNQVNAFFAQSGFFFTDAATEFVLGSGVTFNSLQWWGINSVNADNLDNNFTLTILSADLGTVVDTVNLGINDGTLTAATVVGDYSEYVYNASFADVSLAAGNYFLALSDTHSGDGVWAWETTGGGAQLGGASKESFWLPDLAENLAFQLTASQQKVPEPQTLILFAVGLIALCALHRRSTSA